ncbi:MAG: hypothetical protein AAF940_06395 [Pseudomonadota bacterium]
MQKYLICMPRGGFNDTLCQIEKCWAYAERWNRKLYIDPELSGLFGFLWDLFEEQPIKTPNRKNLLVKERSEVLDIAPEGTLLRELLLAHHAHSTKEFANDDTGRHQKSQREYWQRQSFDFFKDHDDQFLLHMSYGGGTESRGFINRVRLRDDVAELIEARLAQLPEDYVSVHVRCTDMKSNYKHFIASLKESLTGKNALVCSDNQLVVDYAKSALTGTQVHTTESERSKTGKAIHGEMRRIGVGKSTRYGAMLDLITDLVALGGGAEIHVAPTYPHLRGNTLSKAVKKARRAIGFDRTVHVSGFSELAQYLTENKDVLARFMGR